MTFRFDKMREARGMDFQAKDLEKIKHFGSAAVKRYEAAQIFEGIGDLENAKFSYNRAAKDAHLSLYNLVRYYEKPDREEKIREQRTINLRANLKAGEYYMQDGDPVEAAYCFSYAAIRAEELGNLNFAKEMARKAFGIFDSEGKEPVPVFLKQNLPRLAK